MPTSLDRKPYNAMKVSQINIELNKTVNFERSGNKHTHPCTSGYCDYEICAGQFFFQFHQFALSQRS